MTNDVRPAMLTKQEIFDRVARHLLTQGKKSEAFDEKEGKHLCKYRGSDGTKCAVGCLIPDDVYTQYESYQAPLGRTGIEGTGAHRLPETLLNLVGVGSRSAYFLRRLQEVHDDFEVLVWPIMLRAAAEDFELSPAVVDEFQPEAPHA